MPSGKRSDDKEELLELDYPRAPLDGEGDQECGQCGRKRYEGVPGAGAGIPIKPEIQEYQLEDANIALMELKNRKIRGAKVLKIC